MSRKRNLIGLLSVFLLLYVAALVYLIRPMLRDDYHQRALRIDSLTAKTSGDGKSMTLQIEGDGFNRQTEVALVHDLGNHRAVAGSFNTLGAVMDMAFSGNTAYLANREKGLQIVDFSNPLEPVLLDSIYQNLSPLKIVLGKQKLWVALGRDGVMTLTYDDGNQVRSWNNLAAGPKAFRAHLPGHALDLVLLDDHTACVALAGVGICFVSINARGGKEVLSTLPLPGLATRVVRSGTTIYVADPRQGLQIVDAADPTRPRLVKFLSQFGGVGDIIISGDTAYLAANEKFVILDISIPESPTTLGAIEAIYNNKVARLDLDEDKAYLSTKSGLLIIDIEVPSSPSINTRIDLQSPRKVVAREDHLLVAQGDNGIRLIDRKELGKTPPSIFASRTITQDLSLYKDLAYLASGEQGVEIVDIASEPPLSLAVLPMPGRSDSIARHKQTLYVTSSETGVRMLDISEPEHPRAAGILRGSEAAYLVRVAGEKAFILRSLKSPADQTRTISRLQIYDLKVPQSPTLLGEKEFQHRVSNLAATGNRVYLAYNQQGVVIMDVSDPQRPHEVTTAALPWPQQEFAYSRDVVVRDGFAYVANGSEGVQVFDVDQTKKPKLVASVKTPGFANAVALSGKYLYVSDYEQTLLTLDVSNPAKTRITASLPLALVPRKIALAGESLYLMSSRAPLMKVPLPVTAHRVKTSGSRRLFATFDCSDIPKDAIVQVINGPDIVDYPVELECSQLATP